MNAELERAIRNRDECLVGTLDDSRHGGDWLWLMGWADWAAEVEMISEAELGAKGLVSQ